jgi:peptidoglycan/LPS O-acetylase OafA/YrhL
MTDPRTTAPHAPLPAAPAWEAELPCYRYLPGFDGLRGLAVLLMMAHHFSFPLQTSRLHVVSRFGWCGVGLFFVLSGFLITGILLDTKGQPGRRSESPWPAGTGTRSGSWR